MKNQTYPFDEASKNEYHTYGFLITEEGIEFSVDGTVYSSINKDDPFWSNPNDAYRVSQGYNLGSDGLNDYYYFIIGCGIFENGLDAEKDVKFPAQYCVDYVRLYQNENGKIFYGNLPQ